MHKLSSLFIMCSLMCFLGCSDEFPSHFRESNKVILTIDYESHSCISFSNSLRGCVGGNRGIRCTQDGGKTWNKAVLGISDKIQDLAYFNDSVVLALGENHVHYSDNRGETFKAIDFSQGGFQVEAVNSYQGYYLTNDSILWLTYNGGLTRERANNWLGPIKRFNAIGTENVVIFFQDTSDTEVNYISDNRGISFDSIALNPGENYTFKRSPNFMDTTHYTSHFRYTDSLAVWYQGGLKGSDARDYPFIGDRVHAIYQHLVLTAARNGLAISRDTGKTWELTFKHDGSSFLVEDWSFASDTCYILESAKDSIFTQVHQLIIE